MWYIHRYKIPSPKSLLTPILKTLMIRVQEFYYFYYENFKSFVGVTQITNCSEKPLI